MSTQVEPHRGRRTKTARQVAAQFGVTPRHIRRVIAEDRDDYEGRADARRERIVALHRQGLGVRAIARELEVSAGLVSTRLKEARAAGVDLSRLPEGEDQ